MIRARQFYLTELTPSHKILAKNSVEKCAQINATFYPLYKPRD